MVIKVDKYILRRVFAESGRYDYYFSDIGLDFIMGYLDDVAPDIELDVAAICCDFTEFGYGAILSIDNFFSDYADSSFYEFCNNTGNNSEDVKVLVEYLNDNGEECYILENGNVMKVD